MTSLVNCQWATARILVNSSSVKGTAYELPFVPAREESNIADDTGWWLWLLDRLKHKIRPQSNIIYHSTARSVKVMIYKIIYNWVSIILKKNNESFWYQRLQSLLIFKYMNICNPTKAPPPKKNSHYSIVFPGTIWPHQVCFFSKWQQCLCASPLSTLWPLLFPPQRTFPCFTH